MPEIINIPTSSIDVSTLNVRAKHSADAVAAMAASIKAAGVINPPSVKKINGKRFAVVAGGLRVLGAIKAGEETIDVRLHTGKTDAQLVELSLAENVTRQEMSDLEKFVAFERLAKQGRTVADIASTFSMTERSVRQCLAIGALPDKIIEMAKSGELYDDALEALTLATADQLDQFLKLPAKNRPRYAYKIREWLDEKGRQIPVKHALFDPALYTGHISSDLFARADCAPDLFADAEQFWSLQQPIIDKKIDDLKNAGWTVVKVDEWHDWDYQKVAKKDGGKAFVAVRSDGLVTIKSGYLERGRATRSKAPAAARPELSGPMQDYMRAHRHLAIQHALLDNHDVALALAVALLISNDRGWAVRRETFRAVRNEQHRLSVDRSDYRIDCVEQYAATRSELCVKPSAETYNLDAVTILGQACQYDRESLLSMFAATVSERLSMSYTNEDGELDNMLAELLELESVHAWRPDDTFWSGIQNKEALSGIVKEISPGTKTNTSKSTAKQLRDLARKFITPTTDWRPKWLQFPAQAYTKKHGLTFVSKKK